MVVPTGMSDFQIIVNPPTNVNILNKKVTLPVAKDIRGKLKGIFRIGNCRPSFRKR